MAYEPLKPGQSLEPTLTPSELDAAFFAGFYDGEGSVCGRKGYNVVSVHVVQKDPELLFKARDLWGGSITFRVNTSGPSEAFEGYDSWNNPVYRWQISGDRARVFLKSIYPYLSSRRKGQIDKVSLKLSNRIARVSPKLTPERIAKRATMDAHEKYLESKEHNRKLHLEHNRQKDREFQRKKFGYRPRKATEQTLTVQ
ncbi:MAG TPA: LAGLIDADG family homing endonuclease [Nitrospira sp.]|nr:LAGLIDADG family homing endonuclease [Nitrospira sp.]